MNSSVLQHGLIRWVKSNGENILKMLMARSPKLERHRRYPSSGSNNNNNMMSKGSQGRPRLGSSGSRIRKYPQDNHLFTPPMLSPHQVFRPPDHYGNPGGMPLIQMSMPGNIPDFLKHSHSLAADINSQMPQTNAGDHTHIFHPPPPPVVHMQPGMSDPSTPSQSSQHSPVKNVVNDEKQVGNNYLPFDGNVDNHDQYSGSGLLPMHDPPSSVYDPNLFQIQQQQFQQAAMFHNHGGQINMDMINTDRYQHHHRRSDVCRNYLNGHCLYGEKCWFVHSDQKPHREPLLGPGGILNTSLTMGAQPGVFPGMGVDQYGSQYPSTKSPIGGTHPSNINPTWQLHGNRPGLVPFVQRGFMGGTQPQVLLRPFMYQNRFVTPQNDQAMMAAIPDPVLRFRLLSEGMVRDATDSLVADISSLCVRADHFFVTFQKYLRDYQVLFGSDKPHDNHLFMTEQLFNNNITCLHISKINSSLLVIGTANDSVYTFDTKRIGPVTSVNPVITVHESQVIIITII